MRQSHFVGYARNPVGNRRNREPYIVPDAGAGDATSASATVASTADVSFSSSVCEAASGDETPFKLPKQYRKLVVKASKLASDDFNYANLNKTSFSGIEGNGANSHSNALLQVLFHLKAFRRAVQQHICRREYCLTCELSFFLKMCADTAGRQPCLPRNLYRCVRAIGLCDAAAGGAAPFAEAALERCSHELKERPGRVAARLSSVDRDAAAALASLAVSSLSPFEPLCAWFSQPLLFSTPSDCPFALSADVLTLQQFDVDFRSPVVTCDCNAAERSCKWLVKVKHAGGVDASPTLCQSINAQLQSATSCDKCRMADSAEGSKAWPKHLLVDVCSLDADDGALWRHGHATGADGRPTTAARFRRPCRYGDACKRPHCQFIHRAAESSGSDSAADRSSEGCSAGSSWIPSKIVAVKDDSCISFTEAAADGVEYSLVAVVFEIDDLSGRPRHSVACVRTADGWHAFNDLCVTSLAEDDALHWDADWKLPRVLVFELAAAAPSLAGPAPTVDESVFAVDECLAARRRLSSATFVPLESTELPSRGAFVAMDAEFVSRNEQSADEMMVARVTCVRGDGSMEGVPFIDDYIRTQDEVADYVTRFSGIVAADLDPQLTSRHLTTLKSTYLKLRYLVDRGVVFVGHGLNNDFRVINMLVPLEQVRDTVLLFHKPGNRMVSLRFLAWYFLDERIQSETHDSIEDARTALRLFRKWQHLQEGGADVFATALDKLYERGTELLWKLPE